MGSQIDRIGLVVKAAADSFLGRTLTAGAGITVTNGNGVAGNPTVAMTVDPKLQLINAQTGTTYTVAPADLGQLVTINNAGAVTVTIPPALGGNFVDFLVIGAGTVTFVGNASVTLSGPGTLTSTRRYARIRVQWRTSTAAWVMGEVA